MDKETYKRAKRGGSEEKQVLVASVKEYLGSDAMKSWDGYFWWSGKLTYVRQAFRRFFWYESDRLNRKTLMNVATALTMRAEWQKSPFNQELYENYIHFLVTNPVPLYPGDKNVQSFIRKVWSFRPRFWKEKYFDVWDAQNPVEVARYLWNFFKFDDFKDINWDEFEIVVERLPFIDPSARSILTAYFQNPQSNLPRLHLIQNEDLLLGKYFAEFLIELHKVPKGITRFNSPLTGDATSAFLAFQSHLEYFMQDEVGEFSGDGPLSRKGDVLE